MKLFLFWDVEKIQAAIVAMEEQLASGASQVSDPNGGGASFLTVNQAGRVLQQLYDRYQEKTGVRLQPPERSTIINTNVRRHQ